MNTHEPTWPEVPLPLARGQKPGRGGWKKLLAMTASVAWVVSWLVVVVHSRAQAVSVGYAVARATAEERRLKDEIRSLELEATSLRTPRRVGEAAASRMGLRPPYAKEVRRLSLGGQR